MGKGFEIPSYWSDGNFRVEDREEVCNNTCCMDIGYQLGI